MADQTPPPNHRDPGELAGAHSRQTEAVRQVLVDLWERDRDRPGWLGVREHRALYGALYAHYLSLRQDEMAVSVQPVVAPAPAGARPRTDDHVPPASALAEQWPQPFDEAAIPAAAPRPARPGLAEYGRRFISTHAILLMAYLGAFLLMVAALLFLLYGPADLPGAARAVTVGGVNAVLATGAVFCARRQALRLVASTYTAIAALMVPVTLTATYEFVLRDATPLTGTAAIGMSGVACATLYGLLARSLGSRAYASLSLLALGVAGAAGAIASGAGPAVLPAAAAGVVLCWFLHHTGDRAFALPSLIAGQLTAWGTIGAAIGFAATSHGGGSLPAYVPLSCAAIGAAYMVRRRLGGDGLDVVLASALLDVAIVVSTQTLGLGVTGVAASLIGSGLLLATLSGFRATAVRLYGGTIAGRETTLAVAWVAAAELAAAGLVPMAPTVAQLTLVPAAAAGGLIIASRRGASWLATGIAALFLQAAVRWNDQPPLPVTAVYVPITLTVLLAALGAITGLSRRRVLAVPTALTLVAAVQAWGGALQWTADAHAVALVMTALVAAAVAGVLAVRFLPISNAGPAPAGVNNALAWTAALTAAGAGLFAMTHPDIRFAVLGAATGCGLLLALQLRTPGWLAVGLAALAMQTAVDAGAIAGAAVAPAYVPASLGALLLACVVVATTLRDRRLVVPANLCLTVIALTANSAAHLGAQWYAAELVALAYLGACMALVAGGPAISGLLRIGAGARLVLAAAIVVSLPPTDTVILAAGVVCAAWLAYSSRRPEWLYLAGILFGGAWYQAATTVHGTLDARAAVAVLSPLPPIYALFTALLARLHSPLRRRVWITPTAVLAVVAAVAVDGVATGVPTWSVLASSLAVQGMVAYAIGRALRRAELVPLAASCLAGSALALLLAIAAPLFAYPLALAAVAWAIVLAARATSPADATREWIVAHRWAALGVAAVAAAGPLVDGSAFAGNGATATLTELVASLSLALVLWAGVTAGIRVRDRYLAVLVASLAVEWLPVYLGVSDAQAYVVLPSATLVGIAIAVRSDPRAAVPRAAAAAFVAIGCAAAMFTTFVQSLTIGVASWYTAWLLVEGLAALGTAIVFRSRQLSVAGAVAMAAAAGLALAKVVSSVPLYAVFGIAAVLLMVVATLLATQRARIHETRESLRHAWGSWDSSDSRASGQDQRREPVVAAGSGAAALQHGRSAGANIIMPTVVAAVAIGLVAVSTASRTTTTTTSSPLTTLGTPTPLPTSTPPTPTPTPTSQSGWSLSHVDDSHSLANVSCPSPTFCVAIDNVGNLLTSTNPDGSPPAWAATNDLGSGLTSVSCGSASFCAAVDDGGLFMSTNPAGGATWTATQAADDGYLLAVSCPSPRLCVAVDDRGHVVTSTNPSAGASSRWQATTVDRSALVGMSCASPTLCVAVDAYGNVVTSSNPTGGASAWTVENVDGSNRLLAVSCAGPALCVAVDDRGNAVTSRHPRGGASAWTVENVDGSNRMSAVSCAGPALCVAVDAAGNAVTSHDPSGGASAWTVTGVDVSSQLSGVSCPSSALCVGVDAQGNVLTTRAP